AHHPALRQMAVFDLLANNTDRKSGHCLVTPDDRHVWGIDNGLCFSVDWKVRTVVWEFGGEALPVDIADDVGALLDKLPGGLEAHLDGDELAAIVERAEELLDIGTFPLPDQYGRCYPWPLV
ncbi:MAG TPA: phosphatidylinositol kinase, partial [Acidimicrobiales bacterium]|nr:phosphatidylinositol kinase [Acidimicrobiales bacterium]